VTVENNRVLGQEIVITVHAPTTSRPPLRAFLRKAIASYEEINRATLIFAASDLIDRIFKLIEIQ